MNPRRGGVHTTTYGPSSEFDKAEKCLGPLEKVPGISIFNARYTTLAFSEEEEHIGNTIIKKDFTRQSHTVAFGEIMVK